MDDCWVGVPSQHEPRSFYYNVAAFNACSITHPPPYNDGVFPKPYTSSYTWTHFRDQIVGLARCGVSKPLILEECMSAPWLLSLLHSYGIKLYKGDRRTCDWRGEKFVNVIYDILWPML